MLAGQEHERERAQDRQASANKQTDISAATREEAQASRRGRQGEAGAQQCMLKMMRSPGVVSSATPGTSANAVPATPAANLRTRKGVSCLKRGWGQVVSGCSEWLPWLC